MKYKYEKFILELDILIDKITIYKVDTIVAIARGGMTLGHFIAQKMGIREIVTINSIHYDNKDKLDHVIVTNIPNLDRKKNVLIVDDIADSGESLNEILKVLRQKYPENNYKIATLFYKKDSLIKPDFTLHQTDEWIEFFWEVD